jgi:hypothetical protein
LSCNLSDWREVIRDVLVSRLGSLSPSPLLPERDRESDRERDRESDIESDKERDRERDREREREEEEGWYETLLLTDNEPCFQTLTGSGDILTVLGAVTARRLSLSLPSALSLSFCRWWWSGDVLHDNG